MYRSTQEILKALQDKKTTVKTCRNLLSKYRAARKVEIAMMFLDAIELSKFYKTQEETPKKWKLGDEY